MIDTCSVNIDSIKNIYTCLPYGMPHCHCSAEIAALYTEYNMFAFSFRE